MINKPVVLLSGEPGGWRRAELVPDIYVVQGIAGHSHSPCGCFSECLYVNCYDRGNLSVPLNSAQTAELVEGALRTTAMRRAKVSTPVVWMGNGMKMVSRRVPQ